MDTSVKTPIMEVRDLCKYFPVQSKIRKQPLAVKAVNHISFSLFENETLSIVGESGCGKSTTGRALLRLIEPTAGELIYQGKDLMQLDKAQMRALTGELQMVFQDPYSSLNPRMTAGEIVEEPILLHQSSLSAEQRRERAMAMFQKVGLREDQYFRYPHEFSGGQRQRIGLARALVLHPKIVVCDEPVSALDVSIQAQVLNLMREIQREMNVTYLFISHNMSVVRYVSDRIGVMYLGSLVEEATTEELFSNPTHPYTQALLSAIPEADPHVKKTRIALNGDIPSPLHMPSGCPFHNRCPLAKPICSDIEPARVEIAPGHFVRCLLARKRR